MIIFFIILREGRKIKTAGDICKRALDIEFEQDWSVGPAVNLGGEGRIVLLLLYYTYKSGSEFARGRAYQFIGLVLKFSIGIAMATDRCVIQSVLCFA